MSTSPIVQASSATTRRPRSGADSRLAARLERKGFPGTLFKIEGWRQAGLAPSATRTFPGRGHGGSRADYSDLQVAHYAVVAELDARGLSTHAIGFGLFRRDLPIDESSLRRHWAGCLRESLGTPRPRWSLAERRAARNVREIESTGLGQILLGRLEPYVEQSSTGADDEVTETPESMLEDALTEFWMTMWCGQTLDCVTAEDLLRASGFAVAEEGDARAGLEPGTYAEVLARCSLAQLTGLIGSAPTGDLTWARDAADRYFRLARAWSRLNDSVFHGRLDSPLRSAHEFLRGCASEEAAYALISAEFLALATPLDGSEIGLRDVALFDDLPIWEAAARVLNASLMDSPSRVSDQSTCWCDPMTPQDRARVWSAIRLTTGQQPRVPVAASVCCQTACGRRCTPIPGA